jgi:hypothetical protein
MRLRRLPLIALLILAGVAVLGPRASLAAQPQPPSDSQVITLSPTGVDRANALAYSPDGRWLAVGTATGWGLYEAQTFTPLHFVATGLAVRGLAFSPDGQSLATGGYDPIVRLWRAADGALLQELHGHGGWVRSLSFSADGATLATASDDDSVRLWRLSDGAAALVLTEHQAGVRAVALSPDGATLATGGADNIVRLWRAADGALLRELPGHTGWVRCLAFSPDGLTLASGGFDTTARLWRVADGLPLATLAGHTASVLSVAFSPDGAVLATGSVDTTVGLWRAADPSTCDGGKCGAPLARLAGHADFVLTVAFSPDGQALASGAVDNTVRRWPADPAAAQSLSAALPSPVSSNCVTCHHPRGDYGRPGGLVLPPRVVEVTCATCHENGSLVLNWCPAFLRSSGPSGVSPVTVTGTSRVGVARGTRDFALVLAAPGNGEHIYAPAEFTSIPVSGRVVAAGVPLTDVELRLDVWSAGEQVAVAFTRPQADGHFYFDTTPRPDGVQLTIPPEYVTCMQCHSDPPHDAPVLPAGEVRLVVTALSSAGQAASDERWIVVDRGQPAAARVAVVGVDGQPVPGLPVQASTRLYAWRGRTATGTTAADGSAHLSLEALSAAPTEYTFQVPPTVVGGQLYASTAPLTLTVPAGAQSLPPATLTVSAESGRIEGTVTGGAGPQTIYALRLPDGLRYATASSSSGAFVLSGLPIGRYQVLAAAQSAQALLGAVQTVDLSISPVAQVTLAPASPSANQIEAIVRDEQGAALPFAWVSAGPQASALPADPATGAWVAAGLEPGDALVASAPGFYSQARVPGGEAGALQFRLAARPDIRRLPWGAGELLIPAETQAAVNGRRIVLERGWLWGQGGGDQPWTLESAGVLISLPRGRFALEHMPGQTPWLYLFEGEAEVYRPDAPAQATPLSAGSPAQALGVALLPAGGLVAVPLDAVTIAALAEAPGVAPAPVWQPGLAAQLRDRLALFGVTTAQALTLFTYLLSLLALLALPVTAIAWWRRRRRQD